MQGEVGRDGAKLSSLLCDSASLGINGTKLPCVGLVDFLFFIFYFYNTWTKNEQMSQKKNPNNNGLYYFVRMKHKSIKLL